MYHPYPASSIHRKNNHQTNTYCMEFGYKDACFVVIDCKKRVC